jgi:hypothetical protein
MRRLVLLAGMLTFAPVVGVTGIAETRAQETSVHGQRFVGQLTQQPDGDFSDAVVELDGCRHNVRLVTDLTPPALRLSQHGW